MQVQQKIAEISRLEQVRANLETANEQLRSEVDVEKSGVREMNIQMDKLELEKNSVERQVCAWARHGAGLCGWGVVWDTMPWTGFPVAFYFGRFGLR